MTIAKVCPRGCLEGPSLLGDSLDKRGFCVSPQEASWSSKGLVCSVPYRMEWGSGVESLLSMREALGASASTPK